jgi:hypothetical protein
MGLWSEIGTSHLVLERIDDASSRRSGGRPVKRFRRLEPSLLAVGIPGAHCRAGSRAINGDPHSLTRPAISRGVPTKLDAAARSRAALPLRGDPLAVGLLAAGGTELAMTMGLARRAWRLGHALPDAATGSVVHAGALVAGARRHDWRVPLLSTVIAGRVLRVVARLGRQRRRRRLKLRDTSDAVWLVVLMLLRQEAARADAWDAPLAS